MNRDDFINKKKGLIIVRLNPEEYFNKKITSIRDYYYHLGLMHGELLKEEIQELEKYLPEFFVKTRGKTMGKIAYKTLFWAAKQTKKYIRSEYLVEIEGVAKGAGVDPNLALLINVFDELKNCQSNLWVLPALFDRGGCSALAVEENGRLFYGMSTDYTVFGDILGRTNTVFVYRKKFGHNFVAVGWPGYVGLIRGMSDGGIVLISTASYSKDQTIKGIPTSFLYREIIESDNRHILETGPRTIGNNVLIGNEKEVKVIELSAKNLKTRTPQKVKEKRFMVVTNHYETEMKEIQRPPVLPPGSTIPSDKTGEWFWGFFNRRSEKGLGGSKGRFEILEEKIKYYASKEFTPQVIKKILSSVANPYTTLNSMIFDPANLELYMAQNYGKMPATDGQLVKIDVGNLFKL